MAERGTKSLEILTEAVGIERQVQLRHFDSLDSKAGVMLGFAGALAALAPSGLDLIVDAGRALSVAGGLLALWAFWPRGFGTIELRVLRDRYLGAQPSFTRMRLLDAQISSIDELVGTLHQKGWRLKLAMSLMATAALLIAFGSALH